MVNISEKLINDYINGNDIDLYTLEELENDMNFMKAVIAKTKDKKMISFCSDDLKYNPEFVMFVVKRFSNDKKFIYDYSLECLRKMLKDKRYNRNNLLVVQFCLLMIKLINDPNDDLIFQLPLGFIYKYYMNQLIIAKAMNPGQENAFGYGFYFIYDAFNSDEEVTNYFAMRVLKDIMNEHGDELTKYLHKEYKRFEDIKNISFICMNYLQGYDDMLISYLSGHIKPFNDVMGSFFRRLKNRWSSYDEYVDFDKYMNMFDKVHEFLLGFYDHLDFDESDVLLYMGKRLGIIDKVIKYDFSSSNVGAEYLNEFNEREEEFNSFFTTSLTGKYIYDKLEDIITETIFGNGNSMLEVKPKKIYFNGKK